MLMTTLDSALDQLREERNRAQHELGQFDKAIAAIQGVVGGQFSSPGQGKRTMSAAGRRRIAAAQRARWAKVKGLKPTLVKTSTSTSTPRKRTMSASARRKIAAAQRAR